MAEIRLGGIASLPGVNVAKPRKGFRIFAGNFVHFAVGRCVIGALYIDFWQQNAFFNAKNSVHFHQFAGNGHVFSIFAREPAGFGGVHMQIDFFQPFHAGAILLSG